MMLSLDRHAEFSEPGASRLQYLAGPVNLLQNGCLWLVERPPRGDMPLKGAQLAGLVATGVLLVEPCKQRLGFQAGGSC